MLTKVVLVGCGAAFGLLSAALAGPYFAVVARGSKDDSAKLASGRSKQDQDDLDALERRVNGLASHVHALGVEVETEPESKDPAMKDLEASDREHERLPEPENVTADLEAREFTKQQDHAAEPVDAAWASVARRDFQEDLDTLGRKLGASVRSVDCRTSTCKVELEWSSQEAAKEHYQELLSSPLRQNCGYFTLLPSATDSGEGYSHSVFFECR